MPEDDDTPFHACRIAMDAETVRLYEAVRDALAALDKGLLKPEEFLQRLQGSNADADRLLKTALNRTRAVVLYDFARAELENVWAQERQVK